MVWNGHLLNTPGQFYTNPIFISPWRFCFNNINITTCVWSAVIGWKLPFRGTMNTGGHRTRVAAVTLDNMAEDAVAASVSLRQILTVSVRCCGPAFVSWLSMLWDILTRNPELQWFGISPQFRLKVSRGDEGVGHVCFPRDEGVGRLWRGYRCVQMNVGPA